MHAQYSHPAAAFRPQHPYHGSSIETYILPQPLHFEQQRRNYQYISQQNPTPSHHARNLNREPSPPASLQDFRANTPLWLDFNESAARLPDTLSPLNDRVVETETEVSSSLPHPSTPTLQDTSFPNNNNPKLKTKTPPPPRSESSRATPSSFFSLRRTGEDAPFSPAAAAGPSCHHASSSSFLRRGARGGWRISGGGCMRSERKAFEGEKRVLGRKDGDV